MLIEWKLFCVPTAPHQYGVDWGETVLYSYITSPVWFRLSENCFVFLHHLTSVVLIEWKLFCIPTSPHRSGVDWVITFLYSYITSLVWCWLSDNCFVFLHHLTSLVLIEWKLFFYSYITLPVWYWSCGRCSLIRPVLCWVRGSHSVFLHIFTF